MYHLLVGTSSTNRQNKQTNSKPLSMHMLPPTYS